MLILIILLSSLLSILVITLFNIKNINNQVILFLFILVAFIVFRIIFNNIVQKNNVSNRITGNINANNTNNVNNTNNNLNDKTTKLVLSEDQKNTVNVVNSDSNKEVLENEFKESNDILSDLDINFNFKRRGCDEECLKDKENLLKNNSINYGELLNVDNNKLYNTDKIIPNTTYSKRDCASDISCIVSPDITNLHYNSPHSKNKDIRKFTNDDTIWNMSKNINDNCYENNRVPESYWSKNN